MFDCVDFNSKINIIY